MEQLLLMIGALKRGSAKRITAILPFLSLRPPGQEAPGPRTDLGPPGRRPAQDRRCGSDRLGRPAHRPDPGFLRRPRRPHARPTAAHRLHQDNYETEDIVVSPRTPAGWVAEKWADALSGTPLATSSTRPATRGAQSGGVNRVVGEVDGKTCVLTDDMIDTGGTIAGAVKLLHQDGAKDIIIAATTGVLVLIPQPSGLRAAPVR